VILVFLIQSSRGRVLRDRGKRGGRGDRGTEGQRDRGTEGEFGYI
jgi:hypothetical protein